MVQRATRTSPRISPVPSPKDTQDAAPRASTMGRAARTQFFIGNDANAGASRRSTKRDERALPKRLALVRQQRDGQVGGELGFYEPVPVARAYGRGREERVEEAVDARPLRALLA